MLSFVGVFQSFYRLQWVLLVVATVAFLPLGGIHPILGLLSSLGSYLCIATFVAALLTPLYVTLKVISLPVGIMHGVLLLVVSIGLFLPMYPYVLGEPLASHKKWEREMARVSILVSNVELGNEAAGSCILDLVRIHKPDVIALIEATPPLYNQLGSIPGYNYQVNMVEDSHFGVLIYSRFPLAEHQPFFPFEDTLRAYNGAIDLNGTKVRFIVVHPPPPFPSHSWKANHDTLALIGENARQNQDPLIVVGDLNATPHSYSYREMLADTQLKSAMAESGLGWRRTWNMHSYIIRLPIDHMLFQGDLSLNSFQLLPPIGSDHLPLLGEFTVQSASIK